MVFEFLHDLEGFGVPEKLSLVNRRFRKLTLQTPLLWSSILCGCFNLPKATTFVSRSASHLLSVKLHNPYGWAFHPLKLAEKTRRKIALLLDNFQLLVVSLSERLHTLTLDIQGYCRESTHILLDSIRKSHESLTFPHLTTLDITYDHGWSNRGVSQAAHFYRRWSLPSLQILCAENFVPSFNSKVTSQLKSCRLELNYDIPAWDCEGITIFFGSLTSATDLEFILHFQHFYPQRPAAQIELPRLERLTLEFGLWNQVEHGVFQTF